MNRFLKLFNVEDKFNFDNIVKIGDSFFLKPNNEKLKKLFNKFTKNINETNLKFIGVSLGYKKNKFFAPSVFLMKKLRDLKVNFVKINQKGEWLFVCGRDLQGTSIYKCTCEKDEYGLVLNLKNEPLGFGMLIRKPTGTKMCFKRIYDIGDYLRRERNK